MKRLNTFRGIFLVLMIMLVWAGVSCESKSSSTSTTTASTIIDDSTGHVVVDEVIYKGKKYHVFRWLYGSKGTMQVVPISPAK